VVAVVDEHVRRLRRFWEESGSWDEWQKWARESARIGDRDPARLADAIRRLLVLEERRRRLREATCGAEQEDRLQWVRDRVSVEHERASRRVGLLGRLVPHPPLDSRGFAAIDALREAIGSRDTLRLTRAAASGVRRTSFLQTVVRTGGFRRGRALSAGEIRRVSDALDQTRGTGGSIVLPLDGGVEIRGVRSAPGGTISIDRIASRLDGGRPAEP
jgi:hypothetical protein